MKTITILVKVADERAVPTYRKLVATFATDTPLSCDEDLLTISIREAQKD